MLATCLIAAALAAAPPQPMEYIYDAPESAMDVRYVYHWEILRTALDKTKEKWGPYRLMPSEPMTEERQTFEMEHATGKLTVMYLSTTRELDQSLIPIRIPVDKNLGGYCVFLIRKGEQQRFVNIRTLDELRQFRYGLGLGWIDVGILRNSGFDVVMGSNYDGLFEMLVQKRFIEDRILFYYPLPMYFWFPKTSEGRRLAARAEEGMRMMIADGTSDRIFDRDQRHKILRLHLKSRRMFSIPNPNLGPETPWKEKRLWFDPQTFR